MIVFRLLQVSAHRRARVLRIQIDLVINISLNEICQLGVWRIILWITIPHFTIKSPHQNFSVLSEFGKTTIELGTKISCLALVQREILYIESNWLIFILKRKPLVVEFFLPLLLAWDKPIEVRCSISVVYRYFPWNISRPIDKRANRFCSPLAVYSRMMSISSWLTKEEEKNGIDKQLTLAMCYQHLPYYNFFQLNFTYSSEGIEIELCAAFVPHGVHGLLKSGYFVNGRDDFRFYAFVAEPTAEVLIDIPHFVNVDRGIVHTRHKRNVFGCIVCNESGFFHTDRL